MSAEFARWKKHNDFRNYFRALFVLSDDDGNWRGVFPLTKLPIRRSINECVSKNRRNWPRNRTTLRDPLSRIVTWKLDLAKLPVNGDMLSNFPTRLGEILHFKRTVFNVFFALVDGVRFCLHYRVDFQIRRKKIARPSYDRSMCMKMRSIRNYDVSYVNMGTMCISRCFIVMRFDDHWDG